MKTQFIKKYFSPRNTFFCLTIVLLSLILIVSCAAKHAEKSEHSSKDEKNYWTLASSSEIKKIDTPMPSKYSAFKLDEDGMRKKLATAHSFISCVILVPMPDGTFLELSVMETQVMAPELAAKFPLIKTYQGKSIDKSGVTARIEINETDFHVILLTENGEIFIDPVGDKSQNIYISYFKNDAPKREIPFNETPKR